MLSRKLLELEQISLEEYQKLCQKKNFSEDAECPDGNQACAQIRTPLKISNYDMLITELLAMPDFKCTKVAINGKLISFSRDNLLAYTNLEHCAIEAEKSCSLKAYFSAKKGEVHEILFEHNGGIVRSTHLLIPGNVRRNYSWKGKNSHYKIIRAIWVPEEETGYARPTIEPKEIVPPIVTEVL